VARLAALPGVESLSMVGISAVLSGGNVGVALPGWVPDQLLTVSYNQIGARYFETLRTPMVNGREFDDHDRLSSPSVAVVNETLARKLWPDGGAIGATILVRDIAHEVVGVVSDAGVNRRTEAPPLFVYTPFWQNPQQIDARYCIRVTGDPAVVLPTLVREVNRVDPDVPIAETITLPIQMAGWIRPLRISATFIGYAAVLGMLLTAIGLYGTLSFSVSRRTKEIGVRMALGAARASVLPSVWIRDWRLVVLRRRRGHDFARRPARLGASGAPCGCGSAAGCAAIRMRTNEPLHPFRPRTHRASTCCPRA
jgi:hypothetical protein